METVSTQKQASQSKEKKKSSLELQQMPRSPDQNNKERGILYTEAEHT